MGSYSVSLMLVVNHITLLIYALAIETSGVKSRICYEISLTIYALSYAQVIKARGEDMWRFRTITSFII